MPDDSIILNGINGATGEYLTPPLSPSAAAALAAGLPQDPGSLGVLRNLAQQASQAHLGLPFDRDPKRLSEAGWAVVKPVCEFRGPLNRQGHDGLCSGWSEGQWPAVEARFVRIEWFGHNGSEIGSAGRDHPDLHTP